MNIYSDAMMSQGACNLGALIHGWSRAMKQIQAEAQAGGHGTDWINRHPVNVLFAEQVYSLTGAGANYSVAYAHCTEKQTAGAQYTRVMHGSDASHGE